MSLKLKEKGPLLPKSLHGVKLFHQLSLIQGRLFFFFLLSKHKPQTHEIGRNKEHTNRLTGDWLAQDQEILLFEKLLDWQKSHMHIRKQTYPHICQVPRADFCLWSIISLIACLLDSQAEVSTTLHKETSLNTAFKLPFSSP